MRPIYSSLVDSGSNHNTASKVIVVGATGYIGKFVVQECTRRGFDTYAVLRPRTEYLMMALLFEFNVA